MVKDLQRGLFIYKHKQISERKDNLLKMTNISRIGRIFISYHRDEEEKEYVEELERYLKEWDFSVWFDKNIPAGAIWWQKIEEEISQCSIVIVVMTPACNDSDYIKKEIAMAKSSDKPIFPLLLEGDGLEELKGVVVVAATNRPDMIDPALLRPGRFDKIISIGLPDEASRLEILKIHSAGIPLAGDVDLQKLSKQTENFSGADISALCNEAVMIAIEEYLPELDQELSEEKISTYEVTAKNFEEAHKKLLSTRKAGRITSPAEKARAMQEEIDKVSFL